MKLLIFDTETTGLPKSRKSANEGPNNWPHIVSISWVIFNTDTSVIEKQESHIIKPGEWIIPIESTEIHGITNDYATIHGDSLLDVMVKFQNETYDCIVAHNMEFDMNVIVNAIRWDLKKVIRVFPKTVCTMNLSRNICKLPGNYGNFKSPKLKELYFCAFGKMPDETRLHGSLYDVLILTDIIKHYLPLRYAMGLVASNVTTHGIRTLHFNLS
uniref:Exonuclease domain-containing protein n=1 Tax=viral metagenome TaxID=1070528 RepID=A0A6C0JNV8_9ZZZZ